MFPARLGIGFLIAVISMFLGLCDFAKMHHQQRMAALGTDKELSDLLDFSAVRNNGGNEQQLFKKKSTEKVC